MDDSAQILIIDIPYRLHLCFCQIRKPGGRHVIPYMGCAAGAGDDYTDRGMHQHPADGDRGELIGAERLFQRFRRLQAQS